MKKCNIIQLGFGNVGKEVAKQIQQQKEKKSNNFGVNFVYKYTFTSKNSKEQIEKAIQTISLPFVLIDVTTSNQTGNFISLALKRGGYAVLANKRPLAGSFADFKKLHSFGNRLFYETTVGAGLPVIQTIKQLMATGDEIISINGCFSGTLGYICSELEKGIPFSKAVQSAKENGFTEADPREDLSGMDVARKVLILARIIGQKLEPHNVKVAPLFPKSLGNCSVDEFMEKVHQLDSKYAEKMEQAKKKGKVLKFVANVSKNACEAKLVEIDHKSPIGSLQGPDNIIVIQTKRYNDRPLVIQGPGAGPEVTAAGVFADVLKAGGIIL